MLIKADDNYYYSTPACRISVDEKLILAFGHSYLYEVCAVYNRETVVLKTFREKQNAQTFAKRLVEMLNEEETKC